MDFFRGMGYLWGRYYYSCTCTYVCMYINATREAPTSKKRKLTNVRSRGVDRLPPPENPRRPFFANITHPKSSMYLHIISYRLVLNPQNSVAKKPAILLLLLLNSPAKSRSPLSPVQTSITKNLSYSYITHISKGKQGRRKGTRSFPRGLNEMYILYCTFKVRNLI